MEGGLLMKYLVTWNEEEALFEVEPDDPTYDGPVTNIADPVYVYHIEAETEQAAVDAAEFEMAVDNGQT
jgi:hypothetical protein